MNDDWMSIIRGLSQQRRSQDSEIDWGDTLDALRSGLYSNAFASQYMNQAIMPMPRTTIHEDFRWMSDDEYDEPNTIDSWSTDMELDDDEADDNYLKRLGVK